LQLSEPDQAESEERDWHSWCQFPRSEVILRRNTERVSDTIEKGKQRRDVYGLGDLLFLPACVSEFLNIFGGRAIGSVGDQLDVIQ
jgi:hypothetical protein